MPPLRAPASRHSLAVAPLSASPHPPPRPLPPPRPPPPRPPPQLPPQPPPAPQSESPRHWRRHPRCLRSPPHPAASARCCIAGAVHAAQPRGRRRRGRGGAHRTAPAALPLVETRSAPRGAYPPQPRPAQLRPPRPRTPRPAKCRQRGPEGSLAVATAVATGPWRVDAMTGARAGARAVSKTGARAVARLRRTRTRTRLHRRVRSPGGAQLHRRRSSRRASPFEEAPRAFPLARPPGPLPRRASCRRRGEQRRDGECGAGCAGPPRLQPVPTPPLRR
mmetsp:Transcript_4181/g.12129  ORF Transcript_4181/g.12129 Transcript_4181/m.12129 type:complete len:277 (+) Transcript_4181:3465-4295(+)